MGVIKILDESVSNIIAAGEVVENPASMVKELLENSLDAGSTYIKLEIKDGGRYVRIVDNGKGMSQDDLLLCIERHATSKISKKDDLYNLHTYGFRGEALSSVSSVSKMNISSKQETDTVGSYITVLGGKVTSLKEVQKNKGTEIEIKDLFFNTPARLKFLRKPSTEYLNIKDIVIREALANPEVSIVLFLDGKESIRTSGKGMENLILDLFGRNILKNLKKFKYGYLGNISIVKSTKDSVYTFVNGRPVKSKILESAVLDAYYTKLMRGKYPFIIIFLEIDPKEIDVNVHPSKKIVKFSNEDEIYKNIFTEIVETLTKDQEFVTFNYDVENNKPRNEFLNIEQFKKNVEKKIEKKIIPEERIKLQKMEPLPVLFESEEIKCEKKALTENKEYFKLKESICESPKEIQENKCHSKIIGQYLNTYILVEEEGNLVIYDQHIVHERILYEKLKKEYTEKKPTSQKKLVPLRITVDLKERDMILENMEHFVKFGFEIDEFNQNEFLIRAVPTLDFRDSVENLFFEILSGLKNTKSKNSVIESMIVSMSCRGAVKANEKLSMNEMEILIEKLHEIGEYTCPHGRPITFKLTLNDLEKGFKRKWI